LLLERELGVRHNSQFERSGVYKAAIRALDNFQIRPHKQDYDFVSASVPSATERFTEHLRNASGSSALHAHYGCVGCGLG
jgi:hypothetical protein